METIRSYLATNQNRATSRSSIVFQALNGSRDRAMGAFFNKISSTTVEPQILLNAHKYSGLKLMFQQQNHNGHMGARKFWHEYLPTLQFYNPDLQFQVTRVKNEDKKDASVPCTLEILDKENAVVDSLDMRNKQGSEIMQELLEKLEHERVAEEDIVRL